MHKYTYSFIIPHKNCPNLLNRCIYSIPEREDVQVIVVDDNSDSDKKPKINRNGIDLVLLEVDQSNGAGRARNVGLEHAAGKWLLFADADDYYVDGFLDVLDRYKDNDIDVLFFNFHYKDGNLGNDLNPLWFQSSILDYDGSNYSIEQVKYLHNVPWIMMLSDSFVREHGLYFEETVNGNDVFFSLCVGYHAKKVLVEKKPLYVYLKNENSILRSKETVSSAMCRLEHLIKKNAFLRSLGHKEWTIPVVNRVINKTLSLGVMFAYEVFKSSISLWIHRKDWVKSIPLL